METCRRPSQPPAACQVLPKGLGSIEGLCKEKRDSIGKCRDMGLYRDSTGICRDNGTMEAVGLIGVIEGLCRDIGGYTGAI